MSPGEREIDDMINDTIGRLMPLQGVQYEITFFKLLSILLLIMLLLVVWWFVVMLL